MSKGEAPGDGETPTLDTGDAGGGHEAPTVWSEPSWERGAFAGTRLGPYRLDRLIGEGGFGAVYAAEQLEPVRRTVALKILTAGVDSRRIVARFEQERQALAILDHPHIAKVFDAGTAPNGWPYFVMEYCPGEPISTYCDRHNVAIDARLELVVQVCEAVQYAHTKGIIHRDIKPGNVLVSSEHGRPAVKVIDFGIAKAIERPLTDQTLFTLHRELIGTPEYMSPEQAEGSLDIDTRTDVYALGVMLYELLTGTTPFSSKELRAAAYAEIQRILREVDPPPPSARIGRNSDTLATVAARRRTEPRRLTSLVRGELDWIAMKALEKDRQRRYESPSALAGDLRRYLAREAVLAAPPSRGYRAAKFLRRHRVAMTAAAAVAAALLVGTAAFAWQARVARRERDLARAAQRAEAEQHRIADEQAAAAEARRQEALAQRAAAESERREAEAQRRAADRQRDRAVAAEADARARARELQQVADFQSGMLAQIDPTGVGVLLVRDVREKYEAELARSGVPEVERAARSAAFETEWRHVNVTDAARDLLDRTILTPAIAEIERKFKDQPLVAALLRETIAERYLGLGLYDASLPLMQGAYETRRRLLGPEHPDTLDAMNALGVLQQARGKMDEAEPLLRRALEANRRLRDGEKLPVIISLTNVGSFCEGKGRLDEAATLYGEGLERARRVLGRDDGNTVRLVLGVGSVLRAQGKLAEAEPYFREALEIDRRMLGADAPATLDAIELVGSVLQDRGKLAEAEPLLREVLERRRRVQGESHPTTLTAIGNLGIILRMLGRVGEAEPYYREALRERRRVLGDDHRTTIIATVNLGALLRAQDKFPEAEALYRDAVERARRTLGNDHIQTMTAVNSLGGVLLSEKKYDEAERYYREALEARRRVLGEDHPSTIGSINNVGFLLQETGRIAEAETYLRDALGRYRRKLGDDHPETLNTMNNLGLLLEQAGRSTDAEPLLRECTERRRRVLGPEHLHTLVATTNLGLALLSLGRASEAIDTVAPIEEAARRVCTGAQAVRVGLILSILGRARTRAGDFTGAEKSLLESETIYAPLRAKSHADEGKSLASLVALYTAWDTAAPGRGYGARAAEWKARLDGLGTP